MRYFINGIDEDTWTKNRENYWKEFDKLKNDLPKKIVSVFSSGHLHDSEIIEIAISKDNSVQSRHQYNVILKITNENFSGQWIHYDVKTFKMVMQSEERYIYEMDYQYGEILEEDGLWIHNFTCLNQGEIFIKCKRMGWISKLI